MSDYSELVKRLRAYRPTYGWPEEQATVVRKNLGDEAANAIEAQAAEIERLRKAISANVRQGAGGIYPCSPLCAGYLRAEAAEAEVVKLREAITKHIEKFPFYASILRKDVEK